MERKSESERKRTRHGVAKKLHSLEEYRWQLMRIDPRYRKLWDAVDAIEKASQSKTGSRSVIVQELREKYDDLKLEWRSVWGIERPIDYRLKESTNLHFLTRTPVRKVFTGRDSSSPHQLVEVDFSFTDDAIKGGFARLLRAERRSLKVAKITPVVVSRYGRTSRRKDGEIAIKARVYELVQCEGKSHKEAIDILQREFGALTEITDRNTQKWLQGIKKLLKKQQYMKLK